MHKLLAVALAAHTIGTVGGDGFRAEVVAQKSGGGPAPTAVVSVTTYRRTGGGWAKTARRLPGTYFWKTLTAPGAICRLELVTSRNPRVIVQLLQTPSVGCATAQTIAF
jgi:hypothetical protein